MAQQVRATFSLNYGTEAQRFTPSGPSAQFGAGVSASGGFNFTVTGGASVFSRVLLPINNDFDTGSGTGDEGFKFESFPEMEDSAGNPISDVNGLPLDFTTLTMLCVRVRAQDPDLPWGGTVNISTADDVVPGAFSQTGIDSDSLFILQRTNGWTPDAIGSILMEFIPTTAPTPALVNAMVELLVIGNPATPEAPTFSAPPTITGGTGVQDGDAILAVTGTYAGTPTPVTGYQWVRCTVGGDVTSGDPLVGDIPGEVGATYDVATADIGYTLRVRQIAANSAGAAPNIVSGAGANYSVQTDVVIA